MNRDEIVAQGLYAKERIERRMAAQRRAAERDPLVATLPIATDDERAMAYALYEMYKAEIITAATRLNDFIRRHFPGYNPATIRQRHERGMKLHAARLRARRSTQVRSIRKREARS